MNICWLEIFALKFRCGGRTTEHLENGLILVFLRLPSDFFIIFFIKTVGITFFNIQCVRLAPVAHEVDLLCVLQMVLSWNFFDFNQHRSS